MMHMVRFSCAFTFYSKMDAPPFLNVSDVGPAPIGVSSYAGKVVNVRRLDEVINSIDNWYMERGLFGMVSYVVCSLYLGG